MYGCFYFFRQKRVMMGEIETYVRISITCGGLGRYIAYGIAALLVLAGQRQQVGFVADISPDRAAVQQLAERCNAEQLEPCQLLDVVEDSLV